jgi:hypothetical protein
MPLPIVRMIRLPEYVPRPIANPALAIIHRGQVHRRRGWLVAVHSVAPSTGHPRRGRLFGVLIRENFREYLDHLLNDGHTVRHDEHGSDPDLIDPGGNPTVTWRGGVPVPGPPGPGRLVYENEKYLLQIELLKFSTGLRTPAVKHVILFEGRDAAGKGGTIGRYTRAPEPEEYEVFEAGPAVRGHAGGERLLADQAVVLGDPVRAADPVRDPADRPGPPVEAVLDGHRIADRWDTYTEAKRPWCRPPTPTTHRGHRSIKSNDKKRARSTRCGSSSASSTTSARTGDGLPSWCSARNQIIV